jgi:hypothetical protein
VCYVPSRAAPLSEFLKSVDIERQEIARSDPWDTVI